MTEVPTYFLQIIIYKKWNISSHTSLLLILHPKQESEWGPGAKDSLSTFQPGQNPKVLIPSLQGKQALLSPSTTNDLRIKIIRPSLGACPFPSALSPRLHTAVLQTQNKVSKCLKDRGALQQFIGAFIPPTCSLDVLFPSDLFCNTLQGNRKASGKNIRVIYSNKILIDKQWQTASWWPQRSPQLGVHSLSQSVLELHTQVVM